MAGLADFSRRSAGTEAAHERATRYFNAFLAYKDDDDLGSSWAELIAEKNEQLCDPQLWVEFSGYLVYHAVQLANANQRVQADHAVSLLSALTTKARETFPSHPTWSSGFQNWYNGLRTGVGTTSSHSHLRRCSLYQSWRRRSQSCLGVALMQRSPRRRSPRRRLLSRQRNRSRHNNNHNHGKAEREVDIRRSTLFIMLNHRPGRATTRTNKNFNFFVPRARRARTPLPAPSSA